MNQPSNDFEKVPEKNISVEAVSVPNSMVKADPERWASDSGRSKGLYLITNPENLRQQFSEQFPVELNSEMVGNLNFEQFLRNNGAQFFEVREDPISIEKLKARGAIGVAFEMSKNLQSPNPNVHLDYLSLDDLEMKNAEKADRGRIIIDGQPKTPLSEGDGLSNLRTYIVFYSQKTNKASFKKVAATLGWSTSIHKL